MSTHLVFLGTSGSCVAKGRACAGILLEGDKVLDVGFGVVANLLELGKELDEIQEVYITHTHSDHIGDFTGLIWTMAIAGRTRPLHVVGSPAVCASLKRILELQSTPREGFVKFEIVYSTPEKMNVRRRRTIHDPENFAYRFRIGDCELVYTGDTAKSESVVEFSKDADVLIHDSTYLSKQKSLAKLTNHSTAEEAGQVASAANIRKLVLTHLSPLNGGRRNEQAYLREASEPFGGDVLVARDLLRVKI